MRTIRLVPAALAATILLASSVAFAQPGSQPPPPGGGYGPAPQGYYSQNPYMLPGGFWDRRGLSLGFGLGIGGMSSNGGPIECFDCDFNPASLGGDFHIGGMIDPRLAVLFEIWGTTQTLDANGTAFLTQTLFMAALQYWVTPQLWIKGGLGVAGLTQTIDDGYYVYDEGIDSGGALMGAIGYELLSARHFAIDLQLRLGTASYDGIRERINSGTVGVGFNWY
jgi:hypothetical protein